MHDPATREILWNVNFSLNSVLMYFFFFLALAVALLAMLSHVEIWLSGKKPNTPRLSWKRAFVAFILWGLCQIGVARKRYPGFIHILIFSGFLALLFATSIIFVDHDLGIHIFQGNFYLLVSFLADTLGFALIVGCVMALHRRYLKKDARLHSAQADWLVLAALLLISLQGFALEGLRIHATEDPWAIYSPIGLMFSKAFSPLSLTVTKSLHFLLWWFHALSVFIAIALAPYSKFFHLLSSSLNLFLKDQARQAQCPSALEYAGDIEKLMESETDFSIGLSGIKDYSRKQLLSLDACTSCGRCQEVCPACASAKPLSPKWLILDTRNHALALKAQGLWGERWKLPAAWRKLEQKLMHFFVLGWNSISKKASSEQFGAYTYLPGLRNATPQIEQIKTKLGRSVDDRIAGDVIPQETFWACTTCKACVEACPVGINHLDQIVANRRNMVLMNGEIPTEAQKALRALENRGNPFGPAEERAKWAQGLNVRILKPGDEVDCLYWVGCLSAYDPRKQKIARAMVSLLNKASVSFGILGNAERCTGDMARRLGEENLFQSLAKSNIETLRSIKFKTLIANCPHCMHTLKNEYPAIGALQSDDRAPEILHHSEYLQRLVSMGKLKNSSSVNKQSITYHDPCYLGRYNSQYKAPRQLLNKALGYEIKEMHRHSADAMCCGAGGGHFLMDDKSGQRINVMRASQALETKTSRVASACPFCLHMLEDGFKSLNQDSAVATMDIAELMDEQK